MITLVTPAASPALLTAEEMRAAAGLATDDTSQDAALTAVGLRVAADISAECSVAIVSGGVPTLLAETLSETYRRVCSAKLVLSRRHEVAITSVTVDGVVLDEVEYEVDPESGLLFRLDGVHRIGWIADQIVVVYAAGFETVPADLSGAATDLFKLRLSESARDPLVKSESIEIPDVETYRTDYWVGALGKAGEAVPSHIGARLSRFRNWAGA